MKATLLIRIEKAIPKENEYDSQVRDVFSNFNSNKVLCESQDLRSGRIDIYLGRCSEQEIADIRDRLHKAIDNYLDNVKTEELTDDRRYASDIMNSIGDTVKSLLEMEE